MSANTFEDILKAEKPQGEEAANNFTIYKADEDKHLVFGWASVSIKVDGEELEDRQHDMIDPDDLEEAAYEYVLNFRDTGEEHLPGYRKKGKLVESCVFTKDKQKAIGIPEGILPIAWWVGFKIEDEDTWRRVKDGTYKMFSIEGRAHREPVEKAAAPTGCGVLVLRDGKILTGTRKEGSGRGQICGPGGHIEEGETPEDAARREAFEEFGILCNQLDPLGVQDGGGYGRSAVFICENFSGKPKTDEEEMTAPKWVAPETIDTSEAFPPFAQSLELLPEQKTVAKTFEEVLKFNPFHDAAGHFSSAQGMRTYSANPKTVAGQKAIERSFANHSWQLNVHRESKGENIGQNYRWIQTGKFPGAPAAQTGQFEGNEKKVPPKPVKQADTVKPTGGSTEIVNGKDISQKFKYDPDAKYASGNTKEAISQVAEQQGYFGKPQIMATKDFENAVKESGVIGFRTVHDGIDIVSGNDVTGKDFTKMLMDGDASEVSLNGSGGRVFGGGIYMATAPNPKPGKTPPAKDAQSASEDSHEYGGSKGKNGTMRITLDPSAKIGDFDEIRNDFRNQPSSVKAKFVDRDGVWDVGAYAAAKGYDGVRAEGGGWMCDYTMVYNRTKLIIESTPEYW